MKKLFYIFVTVAIALMSCDEQNNVVEKKSAPIPPVIQVSKLPTFPAEVLFVVAREYETIQDGTSKKAPMRKIKSKVVNVVSQTLLEYTEDRLIELYPDVAYEGIVEDMVEEADVVKANYELYLQDLADWEESMGIYAENEVQHEFVSEEDEIEYMQMTLDEQTEFRRLNLMAISENYATTEDFQNFFSTASNMKGQQKIAPIVVVGISVACLAAIGAYAYYRAKLCESRAKDKAADFYPDYRSGEKGDAFKHTYVSMTLRRYLTELVAYLVMDVYWESTNENQPCDKYMDYHNNYVGRHSKYWTFRGKWLADMYNWEKWADNVKFFINNPTSNGIKKNWATINLNDYTSLGIDYISNDENNTDDNKYIYWR
jgi:hypothetical protein